MLGDNAARVYSRMRVAEASQWDVVKAALVAEYAMPCQEAWRRFTTCKLEDGDTIDVFMDRLERFGGRVGMSNQDLSFRAQFYEGLPTSVYEWAVTHESAYTADFGTVLARVREWLESCGWPTQSRTAVRGCCSCFRQPAAAIEGVLLPLWWQSQSEGVSRET